MIKMIMLSYLMTAMTFASPSQTFKYPPEWWAPIPKSEGKSWEILPQEARPGEVILSKRNELGILSNFTASPFTYHGKKYPSLEGFWQMTKYPEGPEDSRARFKGVNWPYTREQVSQMTAFEAKKAGDTGDENMRKMGIDWVTFENKKMMYREQKKGDFYNLIHEVTWEKLRQNPEVKRVLLKTGDLVLKPDHHQEPDAPPAWHYFDIYTEFRQKLLAEK